MFRGKGLTIGGCFIATESRETNCFEMHKYSILTLKNNFSKTVIILVANNWAGIKI